VTLWPTFAFLRRMRDVALANVVWNRICCVHKKEAGRLGSLLLFCHRLPQVQYPPVQSIEIRATITQ